MSATDTKHLIIRAVERLQAEVPSLRRLKLVAKVELRTHGGSPIWRVELPGPHVSKDPAGDARIDIFVVRSQFNELAVEGRLRDWVEAYQRGQVKVTGDAAVVKLLGSAIQRQWERERVRG